MSAAPHAPSFHTLEVADVARDTSDAVVVTFAVPPELTEAYHFEQGQHLTLRRCFDGEELRRNYSICSPVGGPLRVAVRRVPGGVFSNWVNDALHAGDRIEVMTPTGRFGSHVDGGGAHHYVAVAAGSGITPVASILATALDDESATATLLYVNRSVSTTMLIEEVEALRDRHLGRFRVWYAFTRESSEVELLGHRPDRGRLHAAVERGILPDDADAYFLCGPLGLVELVRDVLLERGVAEDRLHSELFTSASGAVAAPRPTSPTSATVGRATAVLNGRATTFEVHDGETLLDAGRRARGDLPFSCLAGACSTCRALVREGAAVMDVCYGLERDEVEAGYVLTCQARPKTETVVLDYDA